MQQILRNKTFQYLSTIIFFVTVFFFLLKYSTAKPSEVLSIKVMHPIYVADFKDDRVLVGASHNVFVGKILKKVESKEGIAGIETQYEVEILENIKGNLKGKIIVNQQGGYKDGMLYVIDDGNDILGKIEKDKVDNYTLKPNSIYLLATRFNEKENWYTLNSFYTARKHISLDKDNNSELEALIQNDERINALKNAYREEILLDADVKSSNTRNSYQSLVDKEKKVN